MIFNNQIYHSSLCYIQDQAPKLASSVTPEMKDRIIQKIQNRMDMGKWLIVMGMISAVFHLTVVVASSLNLCRHSVDRNNFDICDDWRDIRLGTLCSIISIAISIFGYHLYTG